VLDQVSDLISSFGMHTTNVISAIEEAIENKAWESGHVRGPRLKQILEDYNKNSLNLISQKFKHLQDQFRQANPQANGAIGVPVSSDIIMEAEGGFQTFRYNNGYFAVPEGFKFVSGYWGK
jgi:hypothetical protein